MKRFKRILASSLLLALTALTACGNPAAMKSPLDSENPTAITVWHYYNGAQKEAFDKLVEEFNGSAGKEQGIVVSAVGQGSVTDLETSVLESATKKVGAEQLPDVFAAYSDTAFAVDQLGLVVDLAPYFTEEELSAYVPDYIDEGRFSGDDSLKIFPIAKSTEIFMLNKTDWDKFAAATGADLADCATVEGVTALAKTYYEWTDSQTPAPNDGKAFFGRDAMANYFLIGAKQLGTELLSVENGKPVLDFDADTVRLLWDHYYVPYISGYFAANGRFRSDDVKMGDIISFVGSSSGATFFPDSVILSDDSQYPIETLVMPAPRFAEGEPVAVQQGAGMVVASEEETARYASVAFLKWFTDAVRNSLFSIESGYLPVQNEANDIAFIHEQGGVTDGSKIEQIVSVAIDTVKQNELYATKAFANGTEARAVLEKDMTDKAVADREAVVQLIAGGASHADAVAQFDTDENFTAWYQGARAKLQALME